MNIFIPSPRQREQGVATIVILALLSIVLIYVAANVRTLDTLGRELKLVEKQQIRRLNARAGVTNNATAQFRFAGTNSAPAAVETPAQPALP
jgi:hypothetical protein